MKGFTFFNSYYKGISKLSPDERLHMYDAIMAYMFDDEVPELDGTLCVIFDLVKPTLDTSKKRSASGSISDDTEKKEPKQEQIESNEIKTKPKQKQIESNENQTKSNEKQTKCFTSKEKDKEKDRDKDKGEGTKESSTPPKPSPKTITSMIEEKNYSPELKDAVMDWVRYKKERKEGYGETGLKRLLSQIANTAAQYGDGAVISAMNRTMAAGYVGIVWDWAKEEAKNARDKPAEGWGQLHDPYKEWRNDWKGSEGLTVRDGDFERLVIDD